MITGILTHTPHWVWAIFIVLLALGLKQAQPHRQKLRRIILLGIGMVGLSLAGTLSAFGATPDALLAWLGSAVAVALLYSQSTSLDPRVRFDATSHVFHMPGSWTPMALMMGLFTLKFTVGIAANLAPNLMLQAGVSLGLAAVYGAFSGVFIARAVRLWRYALATMDLQDAAALVPNRAGAL